MSDFAGDKIAGVTVLPPLLSEPLNRVRRAHGAAVAAAGIIGRAAYPAYRARDFPALASLQWIVKAT